MKELISIKNQPAIVEVNFEELRASLAAELEKYDVVVTVETVKEAKALATELNQTKKIIDDRRKAEVAKASEPVKAFDAQMKSLVSMCDEGRTKILEQVARFENETKETLFKMLSEKRFELWEDHQVSPEFRKAAFEDLVIISNITAKGSITAKAKDALVQRVNADKAMQQQTQARLLQLENESFKAGLAAPLTRDHVAHFLFEDEARYQSELARIINAEINRQAEAQARERERIERQRLAEEKAKADAEARELERKKHEDERAQREAAEQEAKAKAEEEAKQSAAERELATQQHMQDQKEILKRSRLEAEQMEADSDHELTCAREFAHEGDLESLPVPENNPEQDMVDFLCNELSVFTVQARQIARAIIQGRVPHTAFTGKISKAA